MFVANLSAKIKTAEDLPCYNTLVHISMSDAN